MSEEKKRYNTNYIEVLVKLGNISGQIKGLEFKDRDLIKRLYSEYQVLRQELRPFHFDFEEVKKATTTIECSFQRYLEAEKFLEIMRKVNEDPEVKKEVKALDYFKEVTQEDLDTRVAAEEKELDKVYKPLVEEAEESEKITRDDLDIRLS